MRHWRLGGCWGGGGEDCWGGTMAGHHVGNYVMYTALYPDPTGPFISPQSIVLTGVGWAMIAYCCTSAMPSPAADVDCSGGITGGYRDWANAAGCCGSGEVGYAGGSGDIVPWVASGETTVAGIASGAASTGAGGAGDLGSSPKAWW